MRVPCFVISLALSGSIAVAQAAKAAPVFDVASVKPSMPLVGPDFNNQFSYSHSQVIARNDTLKHLVAEAFQMQLAQVSRPNWLDKDEYDIDAKTTVATTREKYALMLRSLLTERFKLTEHNETREMRVYELVAGKSGTKIASANDEQSRAADQRILSEIFLRTDISASLGVWLGDAGRVSDGAAVYFL
jgi:uncharacterized protein (TIGR03435 family)